VKLDKIANAILRGCWLIDARVADQLYPIAERYIAGEKVAWFDEPKKKNKSFLEAYVFTLEGSRQNLKAQQSGSQVDSIFSDALPGSIAIIPVEGTLMQDDYCGSPGTETLSAWLMDAYLSPNVIGAILKANSPGGSIEGTQEFADTVAYVEKLMPVETFVTGQACSACLWAISSTRITASSGTVEIGSVGTAANFKDYSKGSTVVSHYIPADDSFDKNKDAIEALKGNYTPIKTNIINPTNAIFKAAMKTNRGDKLQLTDVKNDAGEVIGQLPLTGQVYLAQPAMDLGLIDAIGNMDTVMASIRARAASDEFSPKNNSDMSFFNSKFKKLNSLKDKKAAEITDGEMVAVNQELEAEGINNVVIISATHMEQASANADALSEGLVSLNAALGLTGDKQHKTLEAAIGALVASKADSANAAVLTNGLTAINTALGLDAAKSHKTIASAITALVAERDAEYNRAEEYGEQAGEKPTNPKTKATVEGGLAPDKEMSSWDVKAARKIAQFDKATKK
jgi:ClpP class serine protease